MIRYREQHDDFPDIWRVFISGCSSAGKTFFARQLIQSNFIRFNRIYYFHPDFHEQRPVDWARSDMIFIPGCPDMDELLKIPENSCVILDDLFADCKDSKAIDYLFRVLSGKRKLHVLIMTQRYFSNGTYTLNIRNSCNIHVLMRNADELSNIRAARTMNLKKEVSLADEYNKSILYPYIFINKSNQARVSGLQVLIDIFSKYRKVVMNDSIWYLISERDFNQAFTKIDSTTAIKRVTKQDHGVQHSEEAVQSTDFASKDESNTANINTKSTQTEESANQSTQPSKRDFERRVRQVIRRYRKRSLF